MRLLFHGLSNDPRRHDWSRTALNKAPYFLEQKDGGFHVPKIHLDENA